MKRAGIGLIVLGATVGALLGLVFRTGWVSGLFDGAIVSGAVALATGFNQEK